MNGDVILKKKLKFFFDKQVDVLDISIGEPKGAISKENLNKSETLPITATFARQGNRSRRLEAQNKIF